MGRKELASRRLEETKSRKNEIKHPETSRETELKCIKRKIKRPRNQSKHSIKEDSIGKKPIGHHYWQRHQFQVGEQGDRFWTLNFYLIPFKKNKFSNTRKMSKYVWKPICSTNISRCSSCINLFVILRIAILNKQVLLLNFVI